MKKVILILLISSLLILVFSKCEINMNNSITTEKKLNVAEQSTGSLNLHLDIFNITDRILKYAEDSLKGNDKNYYLRGDPYPTLDIEPFNTSEWPKTITFDYGPLNHSCKDSKTRRGIIKITASEYYSKTGSEMIIEFIDFYQNNDKVTGKRFQHNFKYRMTAGAETKYNPEDDEYLISGQQTGKSSDSVSYNMHVSDSIPLKISGNCQWIMKGLLNISINNDDNIKLDYGNGDCDNYAIAEFNNKEYIIEFN